MHVLLWFYYLLKRNVHMFKIVVACIYSGYRFAKIYSGTQSLGNIEFSTNINYYEDQAWTWMFFLILGGVILLIGMNFLIFCLLSRLINAISAIKIGIQNYELFAYYIG